MIIHFELFEGTSTIGKYYTDYNFIKSVHKHFKLRHDQEFVRIPKKDFLSSKYKYFLCIFKDNDKYDMSDNEEEENDIIPQEALFIRRRYRGGYYVHSILNGEITKRNVSRGQLMSEMAYKKYDIYAVETYVSPSSNKTNLVEYTPKKFMDEFRKRKYPQKVNSMLAKKEKKYRLELKEKIDNMSVDEIGKMYNKIRNLHNTIQHHDGYIDWYDDPKGYYGGYGVNSYLTGFIHSNNNNNYTGTKYITNELNNLINKHGLEHTLHDFAIYAYKALVGITNKLRKF